MNKTTNNRYLFVNEILAERFRGDYKEAKKFNKNLALSDFIKKLIWDKLNCDNLILAFKDKAEFLSLLQQMLQYKKMSKFAFFFYDDEKDFLSQKTKKYKCCLNDIFKVLVVHEYYNKGDYKIEFNEFLNQLKKIDKVYIYGYVPIEDYNNFKMKLDDYHVSDIISLSCHYSDYFEQKTKFTDKELKERYETFGYREKLLIKFPVTKTNPYLNILKSKDRDFFIYKNMIRIGEYYEK